MQFCNGIVALAICLGAGPASASAISFSAQASAKVTLKSAYFSGTMIEAQDFLRYEEWYSDAWGEGGGYYGYFDPTGFTHRRFDEVMYADSADPGESTELSAGVTGTKLRAGAKRSGYSAAEQLNRLSYGYCSSDEPSCGGNIEVVFDILLSSSSSSFGAAPFGSNVEFQAGASIGFYEDEGSVFQGAGYLNGQAVSSSMPIQIVGSYSLILAPGDDYFVGFDSWSQGEVDIPAPVPLPASLPLLGGVLLGLGLLRRRG